MKSIIIVVILLFLLPACGQETNTLSNNSVVAEVNNTPIIDTSGLSIKSRFNPPTGFTRCEIEDSSFGSYLRNLPLDPDGSKVKYYDGRTKYNSSAYCAVVNKEIGDKDLHQCADAVMRLRAEYLWEAKRYSEIHFNFTNGFRADYTKWMKGQRIAVNGNNVSWYNKTIPSNDYKTFWAYLERVFMYAGTLSLSKELQSVDVQNMQIGDIFIQGGSPGHAVIVVDMATNNNGEKLFMLAQSYMPAQDIQILNNLGSTDYSPWYQLEFGTTLSTPEWTFKAGDLKRF